MSGELAGKIERLERELQYYQREYNEIGARLLRLQEEQSRASREARRSRIVARLIRGAYQIVNRDMPAEAIGEPLLASIADTSVCDRAAFLTEDPAVPGRFVIEHGLGPKVGARVTLEQPPSFLYTASGQKAGAAGEALAALLGVPYLLWAYEPVSRRALLLGNHTEGNIHRPFEASDQELVEGALSVYIDVLLRKLAETTLRQAATAAEEASNARARFLATLSHELRTPLNAIIGFSELLLDNGTRPPEREEFARQILDAGQSLLSLVRDILDFSSLSNAVPRLQLDWVPVGQLLHASVRAFAAESASRGITVELLPVLPRLQTFIDYDRFRQILSNLLGNAIKFTPAGGKIAISARITTRDRVEIAVCDSGIGMQPEDIPRALEPFVQLENTLSRRFPGTGLGLPIAKQLTEAHQGKLVINSVDGRGTTVMVILPPSRMRLAPEAPANAQPG
jgi:signal transduction histidine kinase